jgi:hypothetical protein
MTRRMRARAACVVLASVLVGVVAAVAVGCGTPATASPEHLGSWLALRDYGEGITVDVAGTPGHYTAQITVESLRATTRFSYSGGKADERGNVTFDQSAGSQLTLGPFSGSQMTAHWTVKSRTSTLDLGRQ